MDWKPKRLSWQLGRSKSTDGQVLLLWVRLEAKEFELEMDFDDDSGDEDDEDPGLSSL